MSHAARRGVIFLAVGLILRLVLMMTSASIGLIVMFGNNGGTIRHPHRAGKAAIRHKEIASSQNNGHEFLCSHKKSIAQFVPRRQFHNVTVS